MILDDILHNLRTRGDDLCYVINDKRYSYAQVYARVRAVYAVLTGWPGVSGPILVYGHKGVWMIASFLACSLAGMAYVPVDASTPAVRVDAVIERIRPGLILGDYACDGVPVLSEADLAVLDRDNVDIEEPELAPDDIDYVIFTSGSTGVPKSVRVTYANLDSCVHWLVDQTGGGPGVVLNQAVFSFDLSVADLYIALVTGGTLVALDGPTQSDYPRLFRALRESDATLAVMTPSFADHLLVDRSFARALLPRLRTILFCGEALSPATVARLWERFGALDIINAYGPTECTVAVTSVRLTPDMCAGPLPLGRPKPDITVRLVDDERRDVAPGEIGEILIRGASVAAGYVPANRHDPGGFIEDAGERAYLTGDLGYLRDGLLYFAGRKDRQVKYLGYRIELGDIECNLRRIPGVAKAVVGAAFGQDGTVRRLLAFVQPVPGVAVDAAALRATLRQRLPDYMCPAIRLVERIPLTEHGKADLAALMGAPR